MKKIILAYGLPASGKTTLLHNLKKADRKGQLLDLDRPRDRAVKLTEYLYPESTNLYIDTLIYSEAVLTKLLTDLKYDFDVTIHYFKENKPRCLENDHYRVREQKSNLTIKNAVLEPLDLTRLQEQFPGFKFQVEEHEIYKMLPFQKWALSRENLVGFYPSYTLTSNSWGTSTYDYPVAPFKELYNFLESEYGSVPFSTLKPILDLVEIKAQEEGDYYSSWTNFFYFLDLEQMYACLVNLNLINPETYESSI